MDLNQVYVLYIETKSGTHETHVTAHVYDDPENALKVEPKHIIERNKSAPVEEKTEE